MADLDSNFHLKAVQARISNLGYPVDLTFSSASGTYAVVSAPPWRSPEEPRLAEGDLGLDVDVRIKAVTGTVDGVGVMLRQIRGLLTPGLVSSRLDTPGWETWIRWVRAEFVDVDQSTTITGSNRHPAFGVETYRLTSEPTT